MPQPYDSIIPCFGSRLTVITLPDAQQYRVHPLGTFHYFDWQKTDKVGISIGTCPQITTSESAMIGVTVNGTTRILPFAEGDCFPEMEQEITPLTTRIVGKDRELGVTLTVTFRSTFYPKDKEGCIAPGYSIQMDLVCEENVQATLFFGLPMAEATSISNKYYFDHEPGKGRVGNGWRSVEPIVFPDGIDHEGIDGLTFEQVILGDYGGISAENNHNLVTKSFNVVANVNHQATFFHTGYIKEPTLNIKGDNRKFAYTDHWTDAHDVANWLSINRVKNIDKARIFEFLNLSYVIPKELKLLLSSSFKGLAANAWWGENDWFSLMEIGAYHSTLDVDYQACAFFFQYWPELVRPMLDQWADFYIPGSGYMAHDVGQHLEATGNRYGGPGSAMKVEENCNYILLLHHYWRSTADHDVVSKHFGLINELVDFLFASDTTGSGLPNQFCDNTNDWGSGLITASEEQSYHGVRMVCAFSAVAQMATHLGDADLATRVEQQAQLIADTLESGWLGDHYPISLSSPDSFDHYSMWTAHGLLYPLRSGLKTPLDLDKIRIDVISSTARTMRAHGSVHSTVDVRGWQTQNAWRDSIAAYLGLDFSHHLRRYLGHGEYVSYEDTTILEVANELMVVPGATAEHIYPGETHEAPMVDGHPRPACIFALPYAMAGIQFDAIDKTMRIDPSIFPLKIPITHLSDWEFPKPHYIILTCERSRPNQDQGFVSAEITTKLEGSMHQLEGYSIESTGKMG